MSKKENGLGRLLLFVSAAAATAAVYNRRKEIKSIVSDIILRLAGSETGREAEPSPESFIQGDGEVDVIIDLRGEQPEQHEPRGGNT